MKYDKIKDYWNDVAGLGCLITQDPTPTLHHIHGGSIVTELGLLAGMGKKQSDWLVIPISAPLHTGQYGIDGCMGVYSWEVRFGRQIDFMDEVCLKLNFNAWKAAGVDRDPFELSLAS